jgi:mannose-1-phosphate guanylyltransferase
MIFSRNVSNYVIIFFIEVTSTVELDLFGIEVKSFKEKPDTKTAEGYLKAGNYFWNSGMFCFKAKVFLEELKTHAPDIYETSLHAYEHARKDQAVRLLLEDMKKILSESIDYAVMEKSQRLSSTR